MTHSKSVNNISAKAFLLGVAFSTLLGINLVIAHTLFAPFYFMFCAVISCLMLIYRPEEK